MGFTPEFTARIESRNGVASIALSGELDIATAPVLEGHLALFEPDAVTPSPIEGWVAARTGPDLTWAG